MKTEHVTELLIDYIENELTAADTSQVDAHITGCAKCAAELIMMRDTFGLLDADPLPEVMNVEWANFLPNVRGKIEKQSLKWWKVWIPRFYPSFVSAFAVLILFIATNFVQFPSTPGDDWLLSADIYSDDPYAELALLDQEEQGDLTRDELFSLTDESDLIAYLELTDNLDILAAVDSDFDLSGWTAAELFDESIYPETIVDEFDEETKALFLKELNSFDLGLI